MEKRLQQLKIVEINGEPVVQSPVSAPASSPAVSVNESLDLIAQLNKNIETLEALEFKFSYMLSEVKSLV